MPIHEKSLIRPENIKTHEKLVLDGVDVSGHWSTFIETRVVSDYNERLQDEIAALPGGEYIHRCWQCGSCTNSCTVNAVNPDFNPALLDLPDPRGHGVGAAARQGHHLAVRLVQQVHVRLPARRVPGGRDEGDGALAGAQGTHAEVEVDDVRRGVLRAGHRDRQDRGGPRHPRFLREKRRSRCARNG